MLVKFESIFKNIWKFNEMISLDFHAWSKLKKFISSFRDSSAWVWMEGSKVFLYKSILTLGEVAPRLRKLEVVLMKVFFKQET